MRVHAGYLDQPLGYSKRVLKSFGQRKVRIPGSSRNEPRPIALLAPDKNTLPLIRYRSRSPRRRERYIEGHARVGKIPSSVALEHILLESSRLAEAREKFLDLRPAVNR